MPWQGNVVVVVVASPSPTWWRIVSSAGDVVSLVHIGVWHLIFDT